MHPQSFEIVRDVRDRLLVPALEHLPSVHAEQCPARSDRPCECVPARQTPTLLDVGSYDVNGTYRPLFADWTYFGVDIAEGPCVDRVIPADEPWDLGAFDVVLSGQCLEHARHPWLLFAEMARHVRPGGHLVVVVPFMIPEHRYPIDGWRFLPDGMRVLAEDSGLKVIESALVGLGEALVDTYLVARRDLRLSLRHGRRCAASSARRRGD